MLLGYKCSKCAIVQDIGDFAKSKRLTRGHSYNCKRCDSKNQSDWYFRNKQRHKDVNRAWKNKNYYGLAIGERETMYDSQNGLCLGCKKHFESSWKGLVLDHDHDTGKARGLLCDRCNWTVGHAKNSVETLRSLANYLEQHNAKTN